MGDTRESVTDLDPREYALAVLWWWHDHANCPGRSHCRLGSWEERGKKRCPPPPPVPRWTDCPNVWLADPRLVECGGCDGCQPGHRCHLNGLETPCEPAMDATYDAFYDDLCAREGKVVMCLHADGQLLQAVSDQVAVAAEFEEDDTPEERRQREDWCRRAEAWIALCRDFVAALDDAGEDPGALRSAIDDFQDAAYNDID